MRRIVRLLSIALLLAACDDPAGVRAPRITGLAVDSADHPLVRTAAVVLDAPGQLLLAYAAEGTPTLVLETDSAALEHRVVLPRLRASRDYVLHAEVVGGVERRSAAFSTAALPADVAALRFEETGQATHPVSAVEVVLGAFRGLVLVEDGEVVWYRPTTGSLFGSTRRANGDFVLLDPSLGLIQVALDGRIVHRLPQPDSAPAAPYGRIHHDVTVTPSDRLLFIANETRTLAGVDVVGEALWEWNPEANTVVRRWSAFDHLDWNTVRGSRSSASNWLHGNGVAFGPRGNVLLSLRNANLVASIAPDFSRVEWTLGGAGSTLQLDATERFWGQHYVSEPANGRVLIYDNGFERPEGRYTRVVEYAIDATAGRANPVWEYRHSPDVFAGLVGSARRLDNGHTVILFGMIGGDGDATGPLMAVEVTADGQERWRLTAAAGISRLYRVTPLASVAGEVRRWPED